MTATPVNVELNNMRQRQVNQQNDGIKVQSSPPGTPNTDIEGHGHTAPGTTGEAGDEGPAQYTRFKMRHIATMVFGETAFDISNPG